MDAKRTDGSHGSDDDRGSAPPGAEEMEVEEEQGEHEVRGLGCQPQKDHPLERERRQPQQAQGAGTLTCGPGLYRPDPVCGDHHQREDDRGDAALRG